MQDGLSGKQSALPVAKGHIVHRDLLLDSDGCGRPSYLPKQSCTVASCEAWNTRHDSPKVYRNQEVAQLILLPGQHKPIGYLVGLNRRVYFALGSRHHHRWLECVPHLGESFRYDPIPIEAYLSLRQPLVEYLVGHVRLKISSSSHMYRHFV